MSTGMKDRFGREIDYLRMSVTQRCNFHCAYCDAGKAEQKELTVEELSAFAAAFRAVGIKKIRLTGGEPLVRDDIADVAFAVRQAGQPETLALTTNGFFLEEKAAELKAAGVEAVNVSLDTLDGGCFQKLTGRDELEKVLRGLQKALTLGFRVRVNAVLLGGVNDDGAGALLGLAKDYPLDLRFIELMPTKGLSDYAALYVSSEELLSRFPFLQKSETDGTAAYYTAPGYRGKVGFISPVSHKFCAACSRVRLLSTGELKPCLGRPETYDLMPYLGDEKALIARIKDAILQKPAGHIFGQKDGELSPMNKIGG